MIEVRTGSDSDLPKLLPLFEALESAKVRYRAGILSAHRTPERMAETARALRRDGFKLSIAAAGGAAHLPGMTASETSLPVIGVPIAGRVLDGIDSLYSIVQMPEGVPVGTVGIDDAEAAREAAIRIIALSVPQDPAGDRPAVGIADFTGGSEDVGVLERELEGLGIEARRMDISPSAGSVPELWSIIACARLELSESIVSVRRLVARTCRPVVVLPLLEPGVLLDGSRNANLLARCLAPASEGEMPPIAMGVNRPRNAALFAARIAGVRSERFLDLVEERSAHLAADVKVKDAELSRLGALEYVKRMR